MEGKFQDAAEKIADPANVDRVQEVDAHLGNGLDPATDIVIRAAHKVKEYEKDMAYLVYERANYKKDTYNNNPQEAKNIASLEKEIKDNIENHNAPDVTSTQNPKLEIIDLATKVAEDVSDLLL